MKWTNICFLKISKDYCVIPGFPNDNTGNWKSHELLKENVIGNMKLCENLVHYTKNVALFIWPTMENVFDAQTITNSEPFWMNFVCSLCHNQSILAGWTKLDDLERVALVVLELAEPPCWRSITSFCRIVLTISTIHLMLWTERLHFGLRDLCIHLVDDMWLPLF